MIPLEELKAHLGVTDTASDDVIRDLEKNAIAFVERQTGQYFGPPLAVTEIITASDARQLWLTYPFRPPVADAIQLVTEQSYAGAAQTTITTAAADGYELRTAGRESRLVRKGGGTWTVGYEYIVTYLRGYKAGYEPGDIRQLVIDLVSLKWNLRGHEGMQSETISGYSYTRARETDLTLIPGAMDTIEAWRRPVLA